MTLRHTQCVFCKHYINITKVGQHPTCSAFPKEIPEEVLWNKFDHKNPYPGDNGVQFEEAEWVNDYMSKARK